MTSDAYASWMAASSTPIERTDTPPAVLPATTAVSLPNAPNSTLVNERFIALLIRIDRMKPEAPSSDPLMIRMTLPIAKPVAQDASPEYELSSATTTGMSAPPIGSTSVTPNTNDAAIIA